MSFTLSVVSFFVMGSFLFLLVARLFRRRSAVPEFLSFSFLAGSILAACFLFGLGRFGLAFDGRLILAGVAVCLFGVFLVRAPSVLFLSGEVSRPAERRGLSLFEKLLVFGIIVQIAWTVFLAVSFPAESHDAVANYALKAKIFHFSRGIPAGFFGWPEETVSHADYPPALPLLMTWIYGFTGFDDLCVKIIMPLIFVSFMLLFYSLSRKFFDRKYSILLVFVLATIPQLYDYATVIHADLLLVSLVTGGFIYFFAYMKKNTRAELVLSSCLFGLAVWVKNEALVFVFAFLLSFVVWLWSSPDLSKRRKAADLAVALLVTSLIALPWLLTRFFLCKASSDMDLSALTPSVLLKNVSDIPVLLDLFQQEIFGPKKWHIFWVVFFAVLAWKRKCFREKEIFCSGIFFLVLVAGYFAGYMLTTGANLFFYVNTTISRFMIHFAGICLFLAAYLVYDWKAVRRAI